MLVQISKNKLLELYNCIIFVVLEIPILISFEIMSNCFVCIVSAKWRELYFRSQGIFQNQTFFKSLILDNQ